MTVQEWGGRALCPAEDWADPAIREEMGWHALEQALHDAELLTLARWWRMQFETTAIMLRALAPGRRPQWSRALPLGLTATWRVTTDDHLGPDASGLVDLTCTLTPA